MTFVPKRLFICLFFLISGEQNILEAASAGASESVGLVANITANLIGFLAILEFINSALSWLGGMVGYPDITFEVQYHQNHDVLHYNGSNSNKQHVKSDFCLQHYSSSAHMYSCRWPS